MKRRAYIAAAGSATTAALAGRSGVPKNTNTSQVQVPAPQVGGSLSGWRQTANQSGEAFSKSYLFGSVTVRGYQHTQIYSNHVLREKVYEETLNKVNSTLSSFFATRIKLKPNLDNLPFGIGRSQIINQIKTHAKSKFKTQLKNQGLTSIQNQSASSVTINTGETAELTKYTANYHFNSITVPVEQGKALTIPSSTIPVEGWTAVWSHNGHIFVSGGAYPNSNFNKHISKKLTQAISVQVNIDLGLNPTQYKSTLFSLIKSVR